jgi:hypothetical protein
MDGNPNDELSETIYRGTCKTPQTAWINIFWKKL